jgi:hypothetical protein
MTRPDRARPRRQRLVLGAVVVSLVAATLGTAAIATDAFGAGDRWESLVGRVERFIAGPVPDRATRATVRVTDPPVDPTDTPAPTTRPTTAPALGVTGSASPTAAPDPTATPTPKPKRVPVDIDVVPEHGKVFASELRKDWCAPAGVQMVLAHFGLVGTGDDVQRQIANRVGEWEARSDSINGEWGPGAMALALEAYGAPGYEVRAFESRTGALRDAARSIMQTGSPVILLAWRGAHTWVMTGFRADADPTVFRDADIKGAYILDPWFPRISSIWGRSDPPGTFQDESEMRRNFLEWHRPEGHYPDRDGLYITVAPTMPAA